MEETDVNQQGLNAIVFMTFHRTIANIITAAEFPEFSVKWDFECGGNQRLQLFCRNEKSNPTKYCHVDGLILDAGCVKVIIEIEESGGSNIRPISLYGKLFPSALSSHFIDDSGCYPFATSVAFVQIVRTKLEQKIEQCKNLQESINCALSKKISSVSDYQIFYGDESDFTEGDDRNELIAHVRDLLGRDRFP
jgi:hypothetical protein